MPTCEGHCCRCFILPLSIKQLRRRADLKFRRGETEEAHETAFVANMLICLGRNPKKIKNIPPLKPKYGKQNKLTYGSYYTCRHFDPEIHLCKVYDQRPKMCRVYPSNDYGIECMFEGCSYDNSLEDAGYLRTLRFRLIHQLKIRIVVCRESEILGKTQTTEDSTRSCCVSES